MSHCGSTAAERLARYRDWQAARADPERGVCVSGIPVPDPHGQPLAAKNAGWGEIAIFALEHADDRQYYCVPPDGPRLTGAELILTTVNTAMHDSTPQRSPLWREEGGPRIQIIRGQVVDRGACWRLLHGSAEDADAPPTATLRGSQVHGVTQRVSLARLTVLGDAGCRAEFRRLRDTGTVPHATQLCGHQWCVNPQHLAMEAEAAYQSRQLLCRPAPPPFRHRGQWLSGCGSHRPPCLSPLPPSMSLGELSKESTVPPATSAAA